MSRILQLREQGQSIWLDYIERSMIASGELQGLVDDGVAGVTSNPTIFQQAIAGSQAYRADLQRLAAEQRSAKEIFESLAIADIQAAADVLRPVYEDTQGRDGYVSMEVAPDLAHDSDATVAEAVRLHALIDRPNLMVKVPATAAGVPAIRQLIGRGLNINVTLIFSLARYAEVREAHLQGLEERLQAGQPLHPVASVASFFVSRVDSMVDALLEKAAQERPAQAEKLTQLMGKLAVANARLAYRDFQATCAGDRWQTLSRAGAQVQRPLWASTSTKNPAYPDLLYVDTLIGPHTVNTMPPATLDAFCDHGVVQRTVEQGLVGAEQVLAALSATGIAYAHVTQELEKEGVQKFADSYSQLLATIEEQRRRILAAE